MNEADGSTIDFSAVIVLCVWWAIVIVLTQLTSSRRKNNLKCSAAENLSGCNSPMTEESTYAQVRSFDPAFSIKVFLDDAEYAYETILQAYARGDLETLNPLVSQEVLRTFACASVERQERNETLELIFVSMKSAESTRAEIEADNMMIDVLFKAEIISVTRSATGEIVKGDPVQLVTTADLWTFSRPIASAGREWTLVATDAG